MLYRTLAIVCVLLCGVHVVQAQSTAPAETPQTRVAKSVARIQELMPALKNNSEESAASEGIKIEIYKLVDMGPQAGPDAADIALKVLFINSFPPAPHSAMCVMSWNLPVISIKLATMESAGKLDHSQVQSVRNVCETYINSRRWHDYPDAADRLNWLETKHTLGERSMVNLEDIRQAWSDPDPRVRALAINIVDEKRYDARGRLIPTPTPGPKEWDQLTQLLADSTMCVRGPAISLARGRSKPEADFVQKIATAEAITNPERIISNYQARRGPLNNPRGAPILVADLQAPESYIRLAALRAFENCSPDIQAIALAAAGRIGSKDPDPKVSEAALPILAKCIYEIAVRAAAAPDPNQGIGKNLADALGDSQVDPQVHDLLLYHAGYSGFAQGGCLEECLRLVAQKQYDENWYSYIGNRPLTPGERASMATGAIMWFASKGSPESKKKLLAALTSSDADLRQGMIQCLSKSLPRPGLAPGPPPLLVLALREGNSAARNIVLSYSNAHDAGGQAILLCMNDPDPQVRSKAIACLTYLAKHEPNRDPSYSASLADTTAALIIALHDPDAMVRLAAAEAAHQADYHWGNNLAEALFDTAGDADPSVAAAAANSLAEYFRGFNSAELPQFPNLRQRLEQAVWRPGSAVAARTVWADVYPDEPLPSRPISSGVISLTVSAAVGVLGELALLVLAFRKLAPQAMSRHRAQRWNSARAATRIQGVGMTALTAGLAIVIVSNAGLPRLLWEWLLFAAFGSFCALSGVVALAWARRLTFGRTLDATFVLLGSLLVGLLMCIGLVTDGLLLSFVAASDTIRPLAPILLRLTVEIAMVALSVWTCSAILRAWLSVEEPRATVAPVR